ncbi:hypothetical protein BDV95DRAFT_610735 [Massariosphaeria phaeospora]|uniref:BTB domain-containing protein n=1 Tax=Massariosphaeria phaeospora TaxID=100035 RepID=A0A7C8M9D2_9PLEO|nr:hypothetical protein BDV95DRAFT_610735 [Massariosphaeria phaeospora]
MAAAPRSKLLASVKDLLLSGNFSDFVLICGGDTYQVHKAIICAQSEFLNAAIKVGGKESNEGKLEMHDDGPSIVKLLVQYFYESDYLPALLSNAKTTLSEKLDYLRGTNPKNSEGVPYAYTFPHRCNALGWSCRDIILCPHHICTATTCNFGCYSFACRECTVQIIHGPPDQLITHVKVYEIADKYAVAELKDLAKQKFSLACWSFWMDPAFPRAAHHTFTLADHMELLKKAEVQAMLTEFKGVAFGVLETLIDQGQDPVIPREVVV